MRSFDEIMFEVRVNMLKDTINRFEKYLDQSEEENIDYPFICEAIVANQKITEQDNEVTEVRGTRRPVNRSERRKATAHAKNHRKALAKYADDEIRTNSGKVINTGYRVYEKGAKLYTRHGRTARDKFTDEPFDPWDTDDEVTMLNLDNGDGYYSDEDIQKAIEEYNRWDDDWDDDWELDDADDDDFDLDLDVDGGNFYTSETALEEKLRLYEEFIHEYNLEKLFATYKANN